jgi:NAD(P)-dependent dehydrogenase (short-subunit alcohol dehydrogenase family)
VVAQVADEAGDVVGDEPPDGAAGVHADDDVTGGVEHESGGTGVTVNAYRPGVVDTAMQAWIRNQDPERIGTGLHERFNKNFAEGTLITPEHSAAALLAHLPSGDTGAIWDVSTAPVGGLMSCPA